MAYSIDISYYNTFILKRNPTVINVLTGEEDNSLYIEESRIRGGYNNTSVDLGVKAHTTDDSYGQEKRINTLIYSGIFNSNTSVNKTNQFPTGKRITQSVDISKGSIQKLFAEDTNLLVFQEKKVSKILVDKDAIYTAEGGGIVTSSDKVLGQVVPYLGDWGIGKNPESFAIYGYQKYFVDKNKGVVLRLSRDGITEISEAGMVDFYRTNLKQADRVYGTYDVTNKSYIVSMYDSSDALLDTAYFDEGVKGWPSRYTFGVKFASSIKGSFYGFNPKSSNGAVHRMWNKASTSIFDVSRNPYVELILNDAPGIVKSFHTLALEGNKYWSAEMTTDYGDLASSIRSVTGGEYTEDGMTKYTGFWPKEGKFFAIIKNESPLKSGEVIGGASISGIKGLFATVKLYGDFNSELFAVSSTYNRSSN